MDDSITLGVLLLNLASTLFMVGVIWFVQVVHYPLMAHVGQEAFVTYEQSHTRRTSWVVGPPMLIELASGLLLVWFRPNGVSLLPVLIGLALLVVVWISTQCVQVPCHQRLTREFHQGVHQRLVTTNWIRTVAWSLRGLVVLWMIFTTFSELHR